MFLNLKGHAHHTGVFTYLLIIPLLRLTLGGATLELPQPKLLSHCWEIPLQGRKQCEKFKKPHV